MKKRRPVSPANDRLLVRLGDGDWIAVSLASLIVAKGVRLSEKSRVCGYPPGNLDAGDLPAGIEIKEENVIDWKVLFKIKKFGTGAE